MPRTRQARPLCATTRRRTLLRLSWHATGDGRLRAPGSLHLAATADATTTCLDTASLAPPWLAARQSEPWKSISPSRSTAQSEACGGGKTQGRFGERTLDGNEPAGCHRERLGTPITGRARLRPSQAARPCWTTARRAGRSHDTRALMAPMAVLGMPDGPLPITGSEPAAREADVRPRGKKPGQSVRLLCGRRWARAQLQPRQLCRPRWPAVASVGPPRPGRAARAGRAVPARRPRPVHLPRQSEGPGAWDAGCGMASTTVVVDLEDGAALSPDRLVARLISAVPEAKETALAAQAEKSWPRLVAAILAHTDAILAAEDTDGESPTRGPAPGPGVPSRAARAWPWASGRGPRTPASLEKRKDCARPWPPTRAPRPRASARS